MKKTYIYSLVCPLDGRVKYVGKANDPKGRFRKHKSLGDVNKGDNIEKNKWIKSLLDKGLLPILEIIEEVGISEWKVKEKFYIKEYKDNGFELFNICGGGNGTSFGNSGSFVGKPKRAVVCLNMDGSFVRSFDSAKEGCEFLGCKINDVLVGKRKKCKGYTWLYKEKYDNFTEEELNSFILNVNTSNNGKNENSIVTRFKKGQISHNVKEVHQYTLDGYYIKTWQQARDAANEYNCTNGNITNCACGISKSAVGYKWSYKLL